jgi:tricarballylate dehydrogenase
VGVRSSLDPSPDVVVLGGGNAALCAAITARRLGCHVLLLEKAPLWRRGGNTRHTRDIRYSHPEEHRYATGSYPESEFLEDLKAVTGQGFDPAISKLLVAESASVPTWMEAQGVKWQPTLRGTLHLNRTNRFFLGGGKALVNTYYDTLENLGGAVVYGVRLTGLELEGNGRVRIVAQTEAAEIDISAAAVVVATGGFEANLALLEAAWGPGVRNYVIRGTPENDGQMLSRLLELGADSVGDPRAFHAVAVDARSPRFDGGIVTRVDAIPYGIAVNRHGCRFYDEGEDLWPKRYAIWGRLIAEQPDQIAYAVFDAKVRHLFIPPVYPPVSANSIEGLALKLGVDSRTLCQTVNDFNASVAVGSVFDPAVLDGASTVGLVPPKSNWALPVDSAPFGAYPLRPGVTFTYRGVRVDRQAHVLRRDGVVLPGVFAAGEIMAGNILKTGYLAGVGLTIGTVFGRIAGSVAVEYARA